MTHPHSNPKHEAESHDSAPAEPAKGVRVSLATRLRRMPGDALGFTVRLGKNIGGMIASLPGKAFRVVVKHPLLATLAALATTAAVLGYVSLSQWMAIPADDPQEAAYAAMISLLNEGNLAAAKESAEIVSSLGKLPAERQSLPLIVLGLHGVAEAEKHANLKKRRELYAAAAKHLELAEKIGFPASRKGAAEESLAIAQFRCDRYSDCWRRFERAAARNPARRAEFLRMASLAAIRSDPPQGARALEMNDILRKDPQSSESVLEQAAIDRARFLLKMNRPDEARQALSEVPPDSRWGLEAGLLFARIRLLEATGAKAPPQGNQGEPPPNGTANSSDLSELNSIAAAFRETAARSADNPITQEARYYLAQCLRAAGDLSAAREELELVRRLEEMNDLGMLAKLESGEILVALGEYEEALAPLSALAKTLNLETRPWTGIPEADMHQRLAAVQRALQSAQQFAEAAVLAETLLGAIPLVIAVELQAQTLQAWGEKLLAEGKPLPPAEAEGKFRLARGKFRQSGTAWARLAMLRYATAAYPLDLARSAENLRRGHDFERAEKMLRVQLAVANRQDRAAPLAALGEVLLSLGRPAAALETLAVVLAEYPNDPVVFGSRILAARARIEMNELDVAANLLRDNLERSDLTPRAQEWRESLFLLGKVLHRQAVEAEAKSVQQGLEGTREADVKDSLDEMQVAFDKFQDAIASLDEALSRFSDSPEAIEARYALADSRRKSARLPRKRLQFTAIESTRASLVRQMNELLELAIADYGQIVRALHARDESHLREHERKILRNCYFGRADALLDLNRFDEAIAACSDAVNRYQNRPESLAALVQISGCHRRLNRPDLARGAVQQAKVLLERMPPEADFEKTTPLPREEWRDLLTWLATQ